MIKLLYKLIGKFIFGSVDFSFRVPLTFPDRQGVRSEPTIIYPRKLQTSKRSRASVMGKHYFFIISSLSPGLHSSQNGMIRQTLLTSPLLMSPQLPRINMRPCHCLFISSKCTPHTPPTPRAFHLQERPVPARAQPLPARI
jgi:hypothetical protein